ncbi:hypothetical protein Leryth_019343 [Lithospermum erythrorhizon]|nr:hypothetical protein Leryth_019343 [Lithospermum erythrorhizon]
MSSVSTQPQFRYTQTPSKVLHLRNLPWECTEEELVELGKPFGRVVNTKCNVGANKNQAFIEFAELNQAISMISYYASSSEPAMVRGKNVYLQYSNRQEIVNNKTTADVAGNVLLVTIEGDDARSVSIDVLHVAHVKELSTMAAYCIGRKCMVSVYVYIEQHMLYLTRSMDNTDKSIHDEQLVFSAFGFVHKITTFEKTAGFQALVQFSDTETASSAKEALDGRSIPRYLIPELGPCSLRITYSAHTDLSVKFQSHRSRDYTNHLLPVAPSAIDTNGQFSVGLDGRKLEPESNVLLASIENMQYAVTLEVLQTVFTAYGPVLKIAMFDKNGGLQALIQYPDIQTAVAAKQALEGHCIYDGGYCKLHISYSRHTDLSIKMNNDRARDYTAPTNAVQPAPGASASLMGSHPSTYVQQQQQPQQQPQPMGGPSAYPYHGTQYAPPPSGVGAHQPPAGWNPAASAGNPPMHMHHHHPYMRPSNMPMMPMQNQGGMPQHPGAMPPYRPQ